MAASTKDDATAAKKKVPQARFYLKLEGVQGCATAAGYEGWIPITSLQFGAGVGIGRRRAPEASANKRKKLSGDDDEEEAAPAAGDIIVDESDEEAFYRRVRETGPRPSEPSVSEVTLTKPSDATSPLLFHYSTLRRPLRAAVIEHVYDRTTIRFTLSSVFISSFSMSAQRKGQAATADDDDDCGPVAPGTESLSLHYQQIELSVVDKVRRPLALPQTPAFAGFNPHQGVDIGFPLPIELIVAIFSWLDQQSLSRASMACKRFTYAASDDQLKVFVAHSTAYSLAAADTHFDGRLVEPFWPPNTDSDNSGW